MNLLSGYSLFYKETGSLIVSANSFLFLQTICIYYKKTDIKPCIKHI
jgi:hypothetical protein